MRRSAMDLVSKARRTVHPIVGRLARAPVTPGMSQWIEVARYLELTPSNQTDVPRGVPPRTLSFLNTARRWLHLWVILGRRAKSSVIFAHRSRSAQCPNPKAASRGPTDALLEHPLGWVSPPRVSDAHVAAEHGHAAMAGLSHHVGLGLADEDRARGEPRSKRVPGDSDRIDPDA